MSWLQATGESDAEEKLGSALTGGAREGGGSRSRTRAGTHWQLVKRTEAMGVQMPVQPPPYCPLLLGNRGCAPHAFNAFSISNALLHSLIEDKERCA